MEKENHSDIDNVQISNALIIANLIYDIEKATEMYTIESIFHTICKLKHNFIYRWYRRNKKTKEKINQFLIETH